MSSSVSTVSISSLPDRTSFLETLKGSACEAKLGEEDENECNICREEYDGEETVAIRLPCQGKHLICRTCAIHWFENQLESARFGSCPSCREKLVRDSADVTIDFDANDNLDYEDFEYNHVQDNFEWDDDDEDMEVEYYRDDGTRALMPRLSSMFIADPLPVSDDMRRRLGMFADVPIVPLTMSELEELESDDDDEDDYEGFATSFVRSPIIELTELLAIDRNDDNADQEGIDEGATGSLERPPRLTIIRPQDIVSRTVTDSGEEVVEYSQS